MRDSIDVLLIEQWLHICMHVEYKALIEHVHPSLCEIHLTIWESVAQSYVYTMICLDKEVTQDCQLGELF